MVTSTGMVAPVVVSQSMCVSCASHPVEDARGHDDLLSGEMVDFVPCITVSTVLLSRVGIRVSVLHVLPVAVDLVQLHLVVLLS